MSHENNHAPSPENKKETKLVTPTLAELRAEKIKKTKAFTEANQNKNPKDFYAALLADAKKNIESSKSSLKTAEEHKKNGVEGSEALLKYEQERLASEEAALKAYEGFKNFDEKKKDEFVKKAKELVAEQEKIDKKPEGKKEKFEYKAAVIDTTELMDAQARDDANFKMTETQEELKQGRVKKWWNRMWKHNIAQDYYRQKHMVESRKNILANKNLYANELGGVKKEGYQGAMDAVMQRFTSEHRDEMLLDSEKKDVKPIGENADINNLVKKYASGDINEMTFEVEKRKILIGINKEYANEDKLFTDNLLKFANTVRDVCKQGKSINDLDIHVELTLGKAKDRLQTEAQLHGFDRVWNKFKNTGIGKLLGNEAAASLVGAAVYSAGKFFGLKALRSKVGQWLTFGGTAVAAGAIVGVNESRRLEQERAQHSREMAKGISFKGDDLKRREQMEKYRHQAVGAKPIIDAMRHIKGSLDNNTLDATGAQMAFKTLVDLEARLKLNAQRNIDLVKYTSPEQLERERTDLDELRAQLKHALRKNNPNFNATFDRELENQMHHLLKNDNGGIEATDKLFKKMKIRRAAMKGLTATVFGGLVGVVGQEITHSLLPTNTDSMLSGTWHHHHGQPLHKDATVLENLRRWMTHENPRVPFGEGHGVGAVIDGKPFAMPDGTSLHDNGDGTFDILRGDKTITPGVKFGFDQNGLLDQHTQELLAKDDIYANPMLTGGHFHGSAMEYIKNHFHETTRMHRHGDAWQHNDTPGTPDYNEQKVYWAGVDGTGLDENGDYVLDVSHMTDSGSWNGDHAVEALQKMHNGELKMAFSLSRDTQHDTFQFAVGKDGLVHIPKNSEVAQLMLSKEINPDTGHVDFNGKFMEVVAPTGELHEDGGEYVSVLASLKGHGMDVVDIDSTVHGFKLDVPETTDIDVPLFLYTGARRPLEQGFYHEDKKDTKHDVPDDKHGITIEKIPEAEKKQIEAADELKKIEQGDIPPVIGAPTRPQRFIEGPRSVTSLEEAHRNLVTAERELAVFLSTPGSRTKDIRNANKKVKDAREVVKNLVAATPAAAGAPTPNPAPTPDSTIVNYGGFDDSELLKTAPKSTVPNEISRVVNAQKKVEAAQEDARNKVPGAINALKEAQRELSEAEANANKVEQAKEIIKNNPKKLRWGSYKFFKEDDMVFVAGKHNMFVKVYEKLADGKIKFINDDTGEWFEETVAPGLVFMQRDIDNLAKGKAPAPAKAAVPATPAAVPVTPTGATPATPPAVATAPATAPAPTATAPTTPARLPRTPAAVPERLIPPTEALNLISEYSTKIDSKGFSDLKVGDQVFLAGDLSRPAKVLSKDASSGKIKFEDLIDKKWYYSNELPNDTTYLLSELKALKEAKAAGTTPPEVAKRVITPSTPKAPVAAPERRVFLNEIPKLINEFPDAIAPKSNFTSLNVGDEVYLADEGEVFKITKKDTANKEVTVEGFFNKSLTFKRDDFGDMYLMSDIKKLKDAKNKGETPPALIKKAPKKAAVKKGAGATSVIPDPAGTVATVTPDTIKAVTKPGESRQEPTDTEAEVKKFLDIEPRDKDIEATPYTNLKVGQRVFISGNGRNIEAIVSFPPTKTGVTFKDAQYPDDTSRAFTLEKKQIVKGKTPLLEFYDMGEIEKKTLKP